MSTVTRLVIGTVQLVTTCSVIAIGVNSYIIVDELRQQNHSMVRIANACERVSNKKEIHETSSQNLK
jgi:hypothetical protein